MSLLSVIDLYQCYQLWLEIGLISKLATLLLPSRFWHLIASLTCHELSISSWTCSLPDLWFVIKLKELRLIEVANQRRIVEVIMNWPRSEKISKKRDDYNLYDSTLHCYVIRDYGSYWKFFFEHHWNSIEQRNIGLTKIWNTSYSIKPRHSITSSNLPSN